MVIGITGGIASGKSSVSQYLRKQGFQIVDADKLAHDALTIDEDCITKVKAQFDCLDDGKINRAKLGTIIFSDKLAQAQLEAIIHPYVIKEIKKAITTLREEHLFLDIPLLYEAHLEYLCDKVLVVYVDERIQLERLQIRNQLSKQNAIDRIKAQMPLIQKKQKADYVIDNHGDVNDLYQQIEIFIKRLKKGEL